MELKKLILGDKEALEKRYGTRYTVLELLPYFDCIKMVSIDAMHNLFMGTSKMMTQLWMEAGLFKPKYTFTHSESCRFS